MNEIKVTFSDGSTEIFREYQSFMTIGFFQDDKDPKKYYPSQSGIYELWRHVHDGLVPSFLELLANSKFFFDVKKPEELYNANAVVKIEIL